MVTLYLFDPRYSSQYPVNSPTTFIRSEAVVAAESAVKRGRSFELWESGKMIACGGPRTDFACRAIIRRR